MDYGTSLSSLRADGTLGLDPDFQAVSGELVVVEAVLKRWQTPRGSLWWDTDAGLDARQFVLSKIDQTRLQAIASQLAAEAEKDERVDEAFVTASMSADRKLRLSTQLVLSNGETPNFVADVTAVSVELVSPGVE